MEATLFSISLWSFFAGMMAHFLGLFPREGTRAGRLFRWLAPALVIIGSGSLTALIIQRWATQGRVPISSSYEYLSVLTWFVAVFYFVVLNKVRKPLMGACISPGMFLGLVFAGMYPRKLEMTLIPALQSYWLKIHVSLTIIGEAVFAVAFVLGILYLVKNYRADRVDPQSRRKSLYLFLGAELVGMNVVGILRALGLVLAGVRGPVLVVCLLGGGFLVAVPLYLWACRRLVADGGGNHGGLIFAMTVFSLLVSGMFLGSLVNRNQQRIESTAYRIQTLDRLVEGIGGSGELTRESLERLLGEKRRELDLYLGLEKLHAQRKHTLSQEEARELIDNSGTELRIDFPLTLGEIRQERRRLQGDLVEIEALAGELGLPVKLAGLTALRRSLVDDYNRMVTSGLLPHDSGRISAFLGYMLLIAVPFFILGYLAAGPLQDRIPELEILDSLAYRTVSLGFPIYTFGALICGAVWAHYAWGKWWSNDPKEIGSLIVWFVYAIYLHARYVKSWSGTQAAAAAVLGFLLAVLGFVGNSVLGGLHAYG
ncbi:MAG: cytochrome c biogenesis protein CcsA [Candidatus Glassbacteria bacterium]|nr:cytochrome c biogenesis protein CcsA [Candidatus Glassbacteria bacterium]